MKAIHASLQWGFALLRELIPPKCWSCRRWFRKDPQQPAMYPWVCWACQTTLPWSDPEYSCAHCGNRTMVADQIVCSHCLGRGFHFDRLWCGFHYQEQVQQWVIQFKYGKNEQMAPFLGKLLAHSLEQYELPQVDGIVPIPLHRKRLQERGFNQALLLAYYTFAHSPLVQTQWLRKIRATSSQTQLSLNQRMENIQNAFHASPNVAGKRILLIDDVATTGTTLDVAAQVLKNAGAISVDAVVFARRIFSEDFTL